MQTGCCKRRQASKLVRVGRSLSNHCPDDRWAHKRNVTFIAPNYGIGSGNNGNAQLLFWPPTDLHCTTYGSKYEQQRENMTCISSRPYAFPNNFKTKKNVEIEVTANLAITLRINWKETVQEPIFREKTPISDYFIGGLNEPEKIRVLYDSRDLPTPQRLCVRAPIKHSERLYSAQKPNSCSLITYTHVGIEVYITGCAAKTKTRPLQPQSGTQTFGKTIDEETERTRLMQEK